MVYEAKILSVSFGMVQDLSVGIRSIPCRGLPGVARSMTYPYTKQALCFLR